MKNTGSKSTCLSWRNSALRIMREYRFEVIFGMVFSIALYSLMMSQQLTNPFDGMWHQNYHQSGRAELSSGRWLLFFLDQLTMGLHADPLTSLSSLLLYVAGFLLVLDLLEVKNRLWACLSLAFFLSSTLISNTLSYRFTSFAYGLAFFLAVLSSYVLFKCKHSFFSIGISGILLGLALSCYQAYLAAFCIIVAFRGIFLCRKTPSVEDEDDATTSRTKQALSKMRVIFALGVALVFYLLTLYLFLFVSHTSLSGYNGSGETNFGSVLHGLPKSILKTFQYFIAYFFQDKLKINRFQSFGIFYPLMALLLVTVILSALQVWKVRKRRSLYIVLIVLGIPVACNAYMLVAGDKLELQMTVGLAMFAPLVFLLASDLFRGKRVPQTACLFLCLALIYGNSLQVWFDQEAMYEGQNACETMVTQLLCDLEQEELLSQDYQYYFVGVPEENPWFHVSEVYNRANAYAQMGRFWISGNCSSSSYDGLIVQRLGFELPIAYASYEEMSKKLDLSSMPMFPNRGYYTLLDGKTVVIKMSDYAPYSGASKYEFP